MDLNKRFILFCFEKNSFPLKKRDYKTCKMPANFLRGLYKLAKRPQVFCGDFTRLQNVGKFFAGILHVCKTPASFLRGFYTFAKCPQVFCGDFASLQNVLIFF